MCTLLKVGTGRVILTRDKKGKRKLNKGVDCRVDGGRV